MPKPAFSAPRVSKTGPSGSVWPAATARGRAIEVFQRLNGLEAARVGAEELTAEEVPFLCFDAAGLERVDGWRADLEQRLRAEDEHPVLLSHLAKYRSLLPAPALILHVIDGVDTGVGGLAWPLSVRRPGAGISRRMRAGCSDGDGSAQ